MSNPTRLVGLGWCVRDHETTAHYYRKREKWSTAISRCSRIIKAVELHVDNDANKCPMCQMYLIKDLAGGGDGPDK